MRFGGRRLTTAGREEGAALLAKVPRARVHRAGRRRDFINGLWRPRVRKPGSCERSGEVTPGIAERRVKRRAATTTRSRQ